MSEILLCNDKIYDFDKIEDRYAYIASFIKDNRALSLLEGLFKEASFNRNNLSSKGNDMSGGHWDYKQHTLTDLLDEVSIDIKETHPTLSPIMANLSDVLFKTIKSLDYDICGDSIIENAEDFDKKVIQNLVEAIGIKVCNCHNNDLQEKASKLLNSFDLNPEGENDAEL